MFEFLTNFFDSKNFMPHGHCYLWRPDILWLNVGSDALIALSYFTIPVILVYFVRKRVDFRFNWIFIMFALFIVACGSTHLIEIWAVWNPQYAIQGIAKLITALISAATAIALVPLMPRALSFPSRKQLGDANLNLSKEINRRKKVEAVLLELNNNLEHAVAAKSKSLRKQMERTRSIVSHVVDGVITVNERFQIDSWNPAAEKIFGYQAAEAIGQNIEAFIAESFFNVQDSNMSKNLTAQLTKAISINSEATGKRKDGTAFPVDLAVSEFMEDDRRFFTGIVRDISERKKDAKELIAARDSAEAANRAKSAFLANMSHEIRTPLGAILGFSELLAEPSLKESDRSAYISAITRNGEFLLDIINDILDLSKIESGKTETDLEEVTLGGVFSDLAALLTLKAADKGINLSISSDASVPQVFTTDSTQLKQILINVIGNAIKFTTKGFVDVKVKYESNGRHEAKLVFLVEDSGIGISPEQAKHLFEPFSQADARIKRLHGGTGLGLALSRQLARVLGGDVSLFESKPGFGSTFKIEIDPGPCNPETFGIFHIERSPVKSKPRQATDAEKLQGAKILLVEDTVDNQVILSRILKNAGAHVSVASNGVEALDRAANQPFDIVLMDLRMPLMDGFEATAELRKAGFNIPIIALTAHAQKEDKEHCLARGFDDYITKPIDRKALLDLIAIKVH